MALLGWRVSTASLCLPVLLSLSPSCFINLLPPVCSPYLYLLTDEAHSLTTGSMCHHNAPPTESQTWAVPGEIPGLGFPCVGRATDSAGEAGRRHRITAICPRSPLFSRLSVDGINTVLPVRSPLFSNVHRRGRDE